MSLHASVLSLSYTYTYIGLPKYVGNIYVAAETAARVAIETLSHMGNYRTDPSLRAGSSVIRIVRMIHTVTANVWPRFAYVCLAYPLRRRTTVSHLVVRGCIRPWWRPYVLSATRYYAHMDMCIHGGASAVHCHDRPLPCPK